jgi:hypothetical protein
MLIFGKFKIGTAKELSGGLMACAFEDLRRACLSRLFLPFLKVILEYNSVAYTVYGSAVIYRSILCEITRKKHKKV